MPQKRKLYKNQNAQSQNNRNKSQSLRNRAQLALELVGNPNTRASCLKAAKLLSRVMKKASPLSGGLIGLNSYESFWDLCETIIYGLKPVVASSAGVIHNISTALVTSNNSTKVFSTFTSRLFKMEFVIVIL